MLLIVGMMKRKANFGDSGKKAWVEGKKILYSS